jgi:YidC/Oxa1 family membrane protein insertase
MDWLADALLWLLKALRMLVFDWGVAIIILVLVVRLAMHPITRKSQIAMMRTGKQMAALKPELEALKARYKDDTTRYQQEQMRLYREKGISPFNMVGGCLPMLLQTPIWASLYAMLYSAIELRNQPAFYGVFQAISGHRWPFLADLSSPDNFWLLPERWQFHIPMLGAVTGLNILPILMGVVFYVQQKIMTPPAADEQARQQQKIGAWTTLLFPVMMYNVPSGLTLYIMASTAAGIVDSTIVRRHIQREEAAGRLFQPKKTKPGGFWDRMQKIMEQKQKALQGGDRRHRFKERD